MRFGYQHYTDQELIAMLNAGDRQAFEEIYHRYAADLLRFARKTITERADAEEIVQDVFVSLWERREALHILSLRHYLFQAVRYQVIRYLQHGKVKQRYEEHFRFFEVMYESAESEKRSPEEIHAALLATLADLPERCQTAVKLRLQENLTNDEIAQRMGISKRTVEVYMFQAFNLIRASHSKIFSN